jgi:hypothetical protein
MSTLAAGFKGSQTPENGHCSACAMRKFRAHLTEPEDSASAYGWLANLLENLAGVV